MTVSTSYLAIDGSNPKAILIANGCPSWYKGKHCKLLAPRWEDVDHYKKTGDREPLIRNYVAKLNKLGVGVVTSCIEDGAVLICYEKTGDFCHRHILADWLREHGVTVEREA